jgi:WD40 repeat protein
VVSWIGLALVLAGCTDDTAGYQFANDPRPTRAAATPAAAATQPAPPPTSPAAALRPFSELIVARGAPERIYFAAGPEVWTVAANGSEPGRVFAPAAGESVLALSSSPTGDRVAVLVEASDGASSVRVFAPDGEVVEEFDEIPKPETMEVPGASPVASPTAGATPVTDSARVTTNPESMPIPGNPSATSIDWSPQGNQLLLGYEPGGLVALGLGDGGESRRLLPVTAAHAPKGAAWSPTGEQVAYASGREGDRRQALYLFATSASSEPPRPLVDEPTERSILDFAWLPDGRALLFTEGDGSPARSTNTDLWRIDADGEGRRLAASAGSAAPVADIDLFAPSPDGRSVAYTVVVPSDPDDTFHSLWIRDLAAGQAYPIAVPAGANVSDLWWTSAGLVFRTNGEADEGTPPAVSFELYRVGTDGAALPILRATVDRATPEATPLGR